MSFSSETKTELCRLPLGKRCCILAELYGVLLYCNTFSAEELRIVTEHRAFGQRAEKLLKKAAGLEAELRMGEESGVKTVLSLRGRKQLARLTELFGCELEKDPSHHVNLGVLEDECCRTSFIRGAFLAGGALTDPVKSYHMELITSHFSVSREVYAILLEMGFKPGSVSRNGNYVTYFKHSEAIEDLLTTLGAPVAAMEIMNAKVEKEITNRVNRRLNCDEANLEKMVNAAQTQLQAIRKLEADGRLDELSEKLREAARLRLENPELSLSQLAAMTVPPVSKSSLNHRLKKLMEIAEDHV